MSVTVSIVSFNTKNLLKKCLQDVIDQNYEGKLEIIVVDNNSQDGTIEMLDESFKKNIKVIKNSENLGFSKAHNQILKNITSDYVILLNPDTRIPQDTIQKMEEFLESRPYCGIASCKIVDFNGNLQSNGGDFPIGTAFLSWLFNLESLGFTKNFHRQDINYFLNQHQVDWVGGTLMMIRGDLVKKVGFLNEEYFMYFEDVDYCFRTRKNKSEVWINPEVEIKHVSGASSRNPKFMQWCGEFKGVIHFYKSTVFHGLIGSFFGLSVRILIYISTLLRILAFAVKGKINYSLTYAKILGCI